jgi:TatD DNase family protein
VGEIGLDYHHAQHTARLQRALCEAQLERAAAWRLPVCVHTRDADADTLALLRTYAATPWGRAGRPGVVHCFTGSAAFAEELLALGFCLGFSGIVTFRNADRLRTVAAGIPADRLLVETDAPFLAPVPMRGQPNEPAFAVHVAACLARQRGVSVAELADLTTANAFRLFGPWGGEEPGG